jgi:hypothetical protein
MLKKPWKKNDWEHYEFRRDRWPEGITSWTYKRSTNPFMWKWFGNDCDGCTPWVHEKQWKWLEWWWRNRAANRANCVSGLALWKEGLLGDGAWPISPTMEKKFWIGTEETIADSYTWMISWCRDSEEGKTWWRPYIRLLLPFRLAFWWGWKPTNGHKTCSIKKVEVS